MQIVQSEAKPAPPALPPRPAIPRLKMPTNEEPQSTGVELPSVDVVPEIKTARPSTDRYLMRESPRLGHKRTGSDQQGEKEKVAKKSKAKLTHKRFVTDLSSLGDGTPRTPRQTPGEKAAAPVPKKPKPLPTRPDMSVNTPRKPWPTTPSTPRAEARAKPQDFGKTTARRRGLRRSSAARLAGRSRRHGDLAEEQQGVLNTRGSPRPHHLSHFRWTQTRIIGGLHD